MSTTYLTLVNSALRRLREDEVSGVANTAYSKMVGDFVNDAKTTVENSHDWSELRSTVVVSTSSGTNEYTMTGSGDRIKLYSVLNDTSNFFGRYENPTLLSNAEYNSDTVSGSPEKYTCSGVDVSNHSKVKLYPTPDATYSLRFDVLIRPGDLSDDSDTIVIPEKPIVH